MPSKETPRLIALGRLLRELRRRAGLLQSQVARALTRDTSHVSRWETGKLLIAEEELAEFLKLVNATSEETLAALRLHRDATDPNWLIPGIGRELAVVREYEDTASHITNWQPLEIPGPLTIEPYAEVTLRSDGATPEQVADWLTFRMARRASLLSGAVLYEAFIGQQAIEYPSAGGHLGAAQLRDLVNTSKLGHIVIRVVPPVIGYRPWRGGSFVLIESDAAKSAVHLESYRSSSTLTNVQDVKSYQDAAEQLRRDAMKPAESAEFIAEVADKLESS